VLFFYVNAGDFSDEFPALLCVITVRGWKKMAPVGSIFKAPLFPTNVPSGNLLQFAIEAMAQSIYS
jgi:hypothetical protein